MWIHTHLCMPYIPALLKSPTLAQASASIFHVASLTVPASLINILHDSFGETYCQMIILSLRSECSLASIVFAIQDGEQSPSEEKLRFRLSLCQSPFRISFLASSLSWWGPRWLIDGPYTSSDLWNTRHCWKSADFQNWRHCLSFPCEIDKHILCFSLWFTFPSPL